MPGDTRVFRNNAWERRGRPSINAKTDRDNLIAGSYRPDPTTAGILPGSSLAVVNGDQTITTAGTVIENKDIYGWINVKAANVIIRNCIIRGKSFTTNVGLIQATDAAVSNLIVEDCLLSPSHPSIWINGINGHDFIARRNEVINVIDYFGVYNTHSPGTLVNVKILQNYCHDMAYFTPDSNHSTKDNQSHNDGTQIQGGLGVHIIGNDIQAYYGTAGTHQPATTGVTPSGAANPALACVLFNVNVGTTGGHTINDNWFSGGYIPINCGGAPGVDLGTMLRNKFDGGSVVTGGVPHTITRRSDQILNAGVGTVDKNIFFDGTEVLVRTNG